MVQDASKARKVVARYIERRRKGTSRTTGIPYNTVDRRIAVWIGTDPAAGAPPSMLLQISEARKAVPSMDGDVAAEVKAALARVPTGARGAFDLAQWTIKE